MTRKLYPTVFLFAWAMLSAPGCMTPIADLYPRAPEEVAPKTQQELVYSSEFDSRRPPREREWRQRYQLPESGNSSNPLRRQSDIRSNPVFRGDEPTAAHRMDRERSPTGAPVRVTLNDNQHQQPPPSRNQDDDSPNQDDNKNQQRANGPQHLTTKEPGPDLAAAIAALQKKVDGLLSEGKGGVQQAAHTDEVIKQGQPAKTEAKKPPADPPKDWDDKLRESIALLKKDLKELKAKPEDDAVPVDEADILKREVLLRLLNFVADDREQAVRGIRGLSAEEQDFWKELVFGLIVYFDDEANPENVTRNTAALQNLRRASSLLATVSDLEVRNAVFCTSVDSFGRFTEVEKPEFRPGEEVIVYVEIDNFSSEQLTTSGLYETALLGSYEILDLANQRVERIPFLVEKDVCRNRRKDFFIPYRVYMPESLKPGRYRLRVTVQDTKTKRSGQSAAIPFTIRS